MSVRSRKRKVDGGSGPAKAGREFSAKEREEALRMLARGIPRGKVAKAIGCSGETVRLWKRAAIAVGTMPDPPQPKEAQAEEAVGPAAGPGLGVATSQAGTQEPDGGLRPTEPDGSQLGPAEVAAILDLKKKHPSMGPAQIRAQLKRFRGWRVAVRAIARVLRKHGYQLEHRGSRPEGDEVPHRFEAPRRNALWQIDFVELRVGPERCYLLIIEDDFSRFVVGHRLVEHPTSEVVVEVMREAIRRHGRCDAVYTDRGGAFLAWRDTSSFEVFLESQLIDHHVGRAYHPQGRGKVEAVIHTVVRELWETVHFESVADAGKALLRFFDEYNHRRAHMGIDGLTPADRFFGRWEEVRAAVEARARRRPSLPDGRVVEERLGDGCAEVLRLMLVDGRFELRFLGHTTVLGTPNR